MKLTIVLAVLIGILVLACSSASPSPGEPTSSINATVEASPAEERRINATLEARPTEERTDENRMEDVPTKERLAKPTATPEPCVTDGEIFAMEGKGEISQEEALAMLKKPRDGKGCPIQAGGERASILPPTVSASSSSTIVDLVDTVGNILDLYDSNEFAADATLTGKWVEMMGKVERVEPVAGKIEVNLIGSQDIFRMNNLVCKVGVDQMQEAIGLRKDDVVVVTGKLLGITGFTNVVAEPCNLP